MAKNIVAAGIADRCEVQVSYAIGVAHPTSISVTTFGTGRIAEIKRELSDWMEGKGYDSLDEFRGRLANINLDKNQNALVYKRAQYIDLLLSSDTIFGNFG